MRIWHLGWPLASLLEPSCLHAEPSLPWTVSVFLARLGTIGHIALISLGCHCSLCCTSASNSPKTSKPTPSGLCLQGAHLAVGSGQEGGSQELSGRASRYLPGLQTGWLSLKPPALHLEKCVLWGPEPTGALTWELGPDFRAAIMPFYPAQEESTSLIFSSLRSRGRFMSHLGLKAPHAGCHALPGGSVPGKAPVLGAAVALWKRPRLAM